MNTYTKKKLISLVAPVLSSLRVHKFFASGYAGIGHILTFHRVIPKSDRRRIHNHLSLEISPIQLENTILFYRKAGYRFVSLDEIYAVLQEGRAIDKLVAFTFDDGYKDNFTVAYPILKKYNVPFAIYITTNFPDHKAILWWYLLEDMIQENTSIQFEWNGGNYNYECARTRAKEQTFDKIRSLINQSFDKALHLELLTAIFKKNEDQLISYSKMLTMHWEEIKTLSADPLCTIGAHTINHFPLSRLDEQQLKYEIQGSKEKIEKQIGKEVLHFAYPFGKVMEASFREFEMVKSLGFKTATTTRIGNVFAGHKGKTESLPRISVNRVTDDHVLNLQSSGLLPFILHKGKKVITN